MSVVVQENQKELDEGLEWIKLRKELDILRSEADAKDRPAYKYNWYMPVGLAITGAFYFYGLYHMHDMKRSSRAAYCRIFSQFCFAGIFAYGFLQHHNKEIKLYKDEMRMKKQAQNAVSDK